MQHLFYSVRRWMLKASVQEILFVRDQDPYYALWEGDIKGPEATQKEYAIDKVLSTTKFKSFLSSLQGINNINHFHFFDDVRDHPRNENDLFSLLATFKGYIS